MGTFCSNIDKEDAAAEQHEKAIETSAPNLLKKNRHHHRTHKMGDKASGQLPSDATLEIGLYHRSQRTLLDQSEVSLRRDPDTHKAEYTRVPEDLKYDDDVKYWEDRKEVIRRGESLRFDYSCTRKASEAETKANKKLLVLREWDALAVYGKADPLYSEDGQEHKRFPGDHFLLNRAEIWKYKDGRDIAGKGAGSRPSGRVSRSTTSLGLATSNGIETREDLIEKSKLFQIAKKMPKGAHLHIHFNSTLKPDKLLKIAKEMDHMYIWSTVPLTSKEDFFECEIQFSILGEKELSETYSKFSVDGFNVFDSGYPEDKAKNSQRPMSYKLFRTAWELHGLRTDAGSIKDLDQWLEEKLVFNVQEAYGPLQTVRGAWEKFNGRTRMMKGLFNYKRAFTQYTRDCLEEFLNDNIQYAEIRPNFMSTNQIWNDNGDGRLNNKDVMNLIVTELENFMKTVGRNKRFGGMKVIYCTPRSFRPWEVQEALDECLQFKKIWPQYIAGFDLVGEEDPESDKYPLQHFIPELLAFQKQVREEGLEIPFLFHCGETLSDGTMVDDNLIDALLLNSKRIGHGYALARKPYIMAEMKKRGVCLELCPISNEVLGLTPRMNGHSMYGLLANDVHCTVNSDNGTLFNSTLSHDFYQVMVGSNAMNLHGWRQLIEWSIEHSCLSAEELSSIKQEWERRWDVFIQWLNEEDFAEPTSEYKAGPQTRSAAQLEPRIAYPEMEEMVMRAREEKAARQQRDERCLPSVRPPDDLR